MSSSVTYLCILRDHYKEPHNFTMLSLSSPLPLKGQLKLSATTTIFLVLFLLTLNNISCEARHLHLLHGKHSSNIPSLPPNNKDIREVNANKEKLMRPSMVARLGSSFHAPSRTQVTEVDLKTKAPASSGGVRNTRNEVRVLRQLLSHHGHTGASCDSLRKRSRGLKARSGMRERSMLGTYTKNEQHVVSNLTTAYTAETLVAMDYLEAHPAPAVHNK